MLKEVLHSLLNVTMELELKTVSKGNVNSIPWSVINKYLRKLFTDLTTKIKMYCNQIITLSQSERANIIVENHSTTIKEHKRVYKT